MVYLPEPNRRSEMPAPLYRDFTTVEEITALYDIEATVPDFGAYAADYVARSAATRERLRGVLDVRFGPTLAETLDAFPGGDGARPTVFFVHGGYWKATDSKVWSYVADGLAPHGVTTVVSNYALAPQVSVAEIVRQHRAAFATVWQRAEELGVDRDNIVIAGHSAGGHAVAALLATDWAAAGRDAGLPVELTELDHNHFTILDELADPDGVLTKAALQFLGR